ncbi:MAG: acyltransferase family protein [Kiritimatiellia bacterium]
MPALKPSSPRIPDVEVLRGIAVLLVLLQHLNGDLFINTASHLHSPFHYWSGWVGVDLFFAISGFVIARSLIPQLQVSKDRSSRRRIVLSFWIRRAWRLFPSACLWLAIILFLVIFFNRSGVFGTLGANLAATWAGLFNYANI